MGTLTLSLEDANSLGDVPCTIQITNHQHRILDPLYQQPSFLCIYLSLIIIFTVTSQLTSSTSTGFVTQRQSALRRILLHQLPLPQYFSQQLQTHTLFLIGSIPSPNIKFIPPNFPNELVAWELGRWMEMTGDTIRKIIQDMNRIIDQGKSSIGSFLTTPTIWPSPPLTLIAQILPSSRPSYPHIYFFGEI